MKIGKNTVVSLDYEIWNTQNELLDKMQDAPIYYLHGKYDDIFRKVESALEGKTIGDELDIRLSADEAFGDINPELIQTESLEKLTKEIGAENIELGRVLEAYSSELELESEHPLLYRITDIVDDTVMLDANPPLAGENLHFKAKVLNVELASEEQIAFGSANLPHQDYTSYDDNHISINNNNY